MEIPDGWVLIPDDLMRRMSEMATIVDKSLVDKIIECEGIYPGDEDYPIVKIVEFMNANGEINWGVIYQQEIDLGIADRYERHIVPTQRFPHIIWEKK